MKIIEAIEKVKEYHQPYTWSEKTRDKILCGDVEMECTGIAVTCCATLEVMQKAVEQGINLIISHEGIIYGYDKAANVDDYDNEVMLEKLKFAKEHNIVVFRDHDAMHGPGRPGEVREKNDMIFYGTMKELGWEPYLANDEKKPLWYKIPTMSARDFGQLLIKAWNLNGLRIVGNLDSEISTVYICEHVNGGERDIPIVENCRKADAIIPLEIVDYTVTTYVRDAATLGMNKVIYEMGHFNAEELGMKYLAKELNEVFAEYDVQFIQSGDGFSYLTK